MLKCEMHRPRMLLNKGTMESIGASLPSILNSLPSVGVLSKDIPLAPAADFQRRSKPRAAVDMQEGPAYSDVEDVILGQDPYGAVRETSELLRGYAAFRDRMPQIGAMKLQRLSAQPYHCRPPCELQPCKLDRGLRCVNIHGRPQCSVCTGRLEECAAAADGREMDRSMAIATLVGARSRFVIRRNSVTIGRAHEDAPGQVRSGIGSTFLHYVLACYELVAQLVRPVSCVTVVGLATDNWLLTNMVTVSVGIAY